MISGDDYNWHKRSYLSAFDDDELDSFTVSFTSNSCWDRLPHRMFCEACGVQYNNDPIFNQCPACGEVKDGE